MNPRPNIAHLLIGAALLVAGLANVRAATPALGAVQDGIMLRDDGTVSVVPHH